MTMTAVGPRTATRKLSVLAEDVVRRIGDRVVLDRLRLEITPSEFAVLLGPPGSGKTTLLRLLGGLDQPDAGTVSVPRARAIVFQGAGLRPWQNVTAGLYGRDGAPVSPEPALILVDEPFAALDPVARVRMHDLVRSLHRRHGATILLVTRDVDEALALADRILVIRDGRIGAEHRVQPGGDWSRRRAREELRGDLLAGTGADAGVSAGRWRS
jgi:sulfonate transport system ATP-binding protein